MNEKQPPTPFRLSANQFKTNLQNAALFMQNQKIDALYITGNDPFLNEYTPLEESHRYYFSGFTGSVADLLILNSGKAILFVDGRYHQQADLETDPDFVEVFKCPYGILPYRALKNKISELNLSKIGIEGQRTPLSTALDLSHICSVIQIDEGLFAQSISFVSAPCLGEAYLLDSTLCGEDITSKLSRATKNSPTLFLSALDSIAWLTNSRGYQLPFQSTFRAKAIATKEKIFLFMEKETLVHTSLLNHTQINIIRADLGQLSEKIKKLKNQNLISKKSISVEFAKITASDYQTLANIFGKEGVIDINKGILPLHAFKNPIEISQMEIAFKNADQAIFNTIKWVKENTKLKADISELDFYHKANSFYQETGNKVQSFKTISAVGSNSSIIHFGSPSAEVKITTGQLILLDSGAYYESGLATDCTRTFLSGGPANDLQKKIYTLVLKSLLNVQNAIFPEGSTGAFIDGVARMPMLLHGYNYAHGTGHGVGINVHEGMYSIVPTSSVGLYAGLVGSLEPGIYLPQIGGVRLENICVVEKHGSFNQMLKFRPLSFVGFDLELIDLDLMNTDEIRWLHAYQKECDIRGTAL